MLSFLGSHQVENEIFWRNWKIEKIVKIIFTLELRKSLFYVFVDYICVLLCVVVDVITSVCVYVCVWWYMHVADLRLSHEHVYCDVYQKMAEVERQLGIWPNNFSLAYSDDLSWGIKLSSSLPYEENTSSA